MPSKRAGNETREMVRRLTLAGFLPPEISKLTEVSRQAVHQHLANLRRDGELPEPEEVAS